MVTETTEINCKIDQKALELLLERIVRLLDNNTSKGDGLSVGTSARILFEIYYGYFFNSERHFLKGFDKIEAVFARIQNGNMEFSGCDYYSGLTGFLAVIANLHKYELIDMDIECLEQFDELVYQWALAKLEEGNTDFFAGAGGVLTYFVNRLEGALFNLSLRERIKVCVFELVEGLMKIAVRDENRHVLIINRHYNALNKEPSEHHLNFGLAHGMANFILNLINLRKLGLTTTSQEVWLDNAVDTILDLRKQYNPPYPFSFVSTIDIHPVSISYQQRVGWCFSDLNIIHLLALYSKSTSNPYIEAILKQSSERIVSRNSFQTNLISDPFLCHGYSGVGLYYLILFNITGDKQFIDGYSGNVHQMLTFYRSTLDEYFFDKPFILTGDNSSLFYGNVGVAMALMSFINPVSKCWSEIILL